MKILKTKRDKYSNLINNLTKEMDKYIECEANLFKTYIYDKEYVGEKGFIYIIRHPGATRGEINMDMNRVITGIKLYEDSKDVYIEDVKNIFSKYIGMKFVINP